MDLLVSALGGMDCILGMEFISQNNVLIEGHNRLVRIPSKSGIVRVKAHKLPCVEGSTIHFMLGKTWERECVGSYGMMCVMRVLDEFKLMEATNLVTFPKCIKQIVDEFLDVMLKELLEDVPPRRRVDHAIEVMPGVAPPAKAPYRMSHEGWKSLRFNLKNFSRRVILNLTNHHMGHPSFLFIKRMGCWRCVWITKPSIRQQWRTDIHCFGSMTSLIDSR